MANDSPRKSQNGKINLSGIISIDNSEILAA
jgi:hypothetical protein